MENRAPPRVCDPWPQFPLTGQPLEEPQGDLAVPGQGAVLPEQGRGPRSVAPRGCALRGAVTSLGGEERAAPGQA